MTALVAFARHMGILSPTTQGYGLERDFAGESLSETVVLLRDQVCHAQKMLQNAEELIAKPFEGDSVDDRLKFAQITYLTITDALQFARETKLAMECALAHFREAGTLQFDTMPLEAMAQIDPTIAQNLIRIKSAGEHYRALSDIKAEFQQKYDDAKGKASTYQGQVAEQYNSAHADAKCGTANWYDIPLPLDVKRDMENAINGQAYGIDDATLLQYVTGRMYYMKTEVKNEANPTLDYQNLKTLRDKLTTNLVQKGNPLPYALYRNLPDCSIKAELHRVKILAEEFGSLDSDELKGRINTTRTNDYNVKGDYGTTIALLMAQENGGGLLFEEDVRYLCEFFANHQKKHAKTLYNKYFQNNKCRLPSRVQS